MVRATGIVLCLAGLALIGGGCGGDGDVGTDRATDEGQQEQEIIVDSAAVLDPPLAQAAKASASASDGAGVIDAQLDGDLDKFCRGELDLVGIEGDVSDGQGCARQEAAVVIPVEIPGAGTQVRGGAYLVSEGSFRRTEVQALASRLVDILAQSDGVKLAPTFQGLPSMQG